MWQTLFPQPLRVNSVTLSIVEAAKYSSVKKLYSLLLKRNTCPALGRSQYFLY